MSSLTAGVFLRVLGLRFDLGAIVEEIEEEEESGNVEHRSRSEVTGDARETSVQNSWKLLEETWGRVLKGP